MSSSYDPKVVEGPIFESWVKGNYFSATPIEGVRPYSVVIPPPNVTGSLHMGHALNNTIQDVVVRRSRMTGRPTRWVVGTDHAGIATQNKVEQKLAAEGKSRDDVGREAFVDACWEWRHEHGSTIIGQLKAMGCSCDYSDEWFTMDPSYQAAVRKVFVEWFNQGLIYRGKRIINWCPRCSTALSDIEVEHEDVDSHLWHLRYPLKEPVAGIDHVIVATTRPETMLGDTCIAVHPDDERYRALVGATVVLPLVGREIPIVADSYVDPSFGSGAVKVTPAHDPNDFEIGERHDCAKINVMNADATIAAEGGAYAGLDRFEARKKVVADLDAQGLLVKIDDHVHSVGHCYRCHTIIEPWLSDQWFVDMKPLAAPAIEAVRDGRVTFHPKRWENVYFHWMENIRDWCISRQLWWGHRIPVFYCDACGAMVASVEDVKSCSACGSSAIRQDEDVLDTWFSSQLWPFATFGWPEPDPRVDYFYPTSVLSTARDILFLWVARMVMSGMYFLDGKVPFDDVIIHPTVFNAEGKRMSKSLGTGVDPLDLMEHYGADGMRFGLMLQVTGAQDLKFSEEKLVSSRNFANKIWNASRFVLMNLDDYEPGEPVAHTVADRWILSRLAALSARVSEGLDTYEFGEVARSLYDFFWNEYCDWYIELAKGRLHEGGEARASVQRILVYVLDNALRLLHPIMPFVTEEIWRNLPLAGVEKAPSLMVASWPDGVALASFADDGAERSIARIIEIVTGIRAVRSRYKLPVKQSLQVVFKTQGDSERQWVDNEFGQMASLAGVSTFTAGVAASKPAHSATVIASGMEVYIPLEGLVDFEAEALRLAKEAEKLSAELEKFNRKLSNEGFLAKASAEIISKDRAKAAELAEELALVQAQLADLD
ncbi:MAG: valine--tRNA ligase [Actinobacteria bacterium HGW-Actinobacteria-7]|jgi:valyl-tRNA synthetase|nr:MAG: valine--tRNA ligase [Actinobacteria bacterium HGW-Actinobacteria-7]